MYVLRLYALGRWVPGDGAGAGEGAGFGAGVGAGFGAGIRRGRRCGTRARRWCRDREADSARVMATVPAPGGAESVRASVRVPARASAPATVVVVGSFFLAFVVVGVVCRVVGVCTFVDAVVTVTATFFDDELFDDSANAMPPSASTPAIAAADDDQHPPTMIRGRSSMGTVEIVASGRFGDGDRRAGAWRPGGRSRGSAVTPRGDRRVEMAPSVGSRNGVIAVIHTLDGHRRELGRDSSCREPGNERVEVGRVLWSRTLGTSTVPPRRSHRLPAQRTRVGAEDIDERAPYPGTHPTRGARRSRERRW